MPAADLVRECPPLPAPPSPETDDVTLAIWVAETRLAAEACTHRHKALIDWAVKK